jgi:hypothetical protein
VDYSATPPSTMVRRSPASLPRWANPLTPGGRGSSHVAVRNSGTAVIVAARARHERLGDSRAESQAERPSRFAEPLSVARGESRGQARRVWPRRRPVLSVGGFGSWRIRPGDRALPRVVVGSSAARRAPHIALELPPPARIPLGRSPLEICRKRLEHAEPQRRGLDNGLGPAGAAFPRPRPAQPRAERGARTS